MRTLPGLRNLLTTLGADVLYVSRQNWLNRSHAEWLQSMKRRPISLDQFRALEKQSPFALAVAPSTEDDMSVKFKNRRSDSVNVIGTTDAYLLTSGVGVALGRFLTAAEAEENRATSCGSRTGAGLFH